MHRLVLCLFALVGFVAAAAPLRADDGHCARPVVAVETHAHGHALVSVLPAQAVTGDHGCPDCPARTCGSMQGCSAASQVAPDLAAVGSMRMPVSDSALPDSQDHPVSVIHSPPTPPPLVALSPA